MALIAPGSRLGSYEIEVLIGQGGMGEVYRARDPRLNRDVAVKVLTPGLLPGPRNLARFVREASTGALINHPNIVAVYDVGSHDDMPFVVSELLQGDTLRRKMRGGAVPASVALKYARHVTEGLAAAHQIGIIHGDVKPENIFVTTAGTVKVMDFGIAKCRQAALEGLQDTSVATWPNMLLGTVGYMSPEQIRGLALDERADIFSVGAMLYEIVAGIPPFRGSSPMETLGAILNQEPRRLRDYCQTPPELERIVRHCLEKDREYRFQTSRDLLFNLELAASEAPLKAAQMKRHNHKPLLSDIVTSLFR